MEAIIMFALVVLTSLLTTLAVSFVPSYAKQKGKNLATKEDVQAITEQVENIKNRYERENERLRHALERSSHASKFQFEKEYDLYREIWRSLVELKGATVSLRPVFDWVDPKESDEERKRKRLDRFSDAYQKTGLLCEGNRPFYPSKIWEELKRLLDIAFREAVDYRHKTEGRDVEKYWEGAQAAQKATLSQIEIVGDAIRGRLKEFQDA